MVLPATVSLFGGDRAPEVTSLLKSGLSAIGTRIVAGDGPPASTPIRLVNTTRANHLGPEAYHLVIDANGIVINATSGAGFFYGAQSLLQIVTSDGIRPATIPFVDIVDSPEYRWRGLHLDVSRHFFSKDVIEQFIDVAARFKLNVFHWHLTDDQGWRLEVPPYPNLTLIGGCRSATQVGGFASHKNDGIRFCAWYTEDDVREVVAFAKARHVMIVPEIEGPGHSVEAMAAYPELACSPAEYEPLVYWGSTSYSLCPSDATFAFYDAVFRELSELFPGPYVHIGGDEVPYTSWRRNRTVLALMRRESLNSYADVQTYFTRRIEGIARKYHRRIVGWNDIEKAGVSNDAVIMAWTDREAGVAAARHGNDVVMTPGPPLYFDAYQSHEDGEPEAIGGLTTLHDVYDFDPSAGFDDPATHQRLLGAQANLWTEYIPTREHLWYMAYPRALALSELCWTPRSRMSWSDFERRLGPALTRLEPLGVTFRVPPVIFESTENGTALHLADVISNAQIWYSLNGGALNRTWFRYRGPIPIGSQTQVFAFATVTGYRASVSAHNSLKNLSKVSHDDPVGRST